ncbi:hypothetical protein GCM10010412_098720 [Nonomuraea recticatena]|uniref:Radical SAM core domain-containing protein n=1 Tax=Nonomuraea recticatena TaxID=46178 RepID=A0ABP6FUG5_9ACTN
MDTVRRSREAGMSACSGLIAGMGESDADLVDVVFALRELEVDSVPVNFLIPFQALRSRRWPQPQSSGELDHGCGSWSSRIARTGA